MVWVEILLVFGIILLIGIALFMTKRILPFIINSIIGFFALVAARIFLPTLDIWPWATIITGIGGIVGFVIVIVLHLLGIAF